MFAGLINDEVQENIIWPELPYVTDEHGSMSRILDFPHRPQILSLLFY